MRTSGIIRRMTESDLEVRAASYARVSTAQQARGESLDAHISKASKHIEYHEWTLTKVYKDAGRSGRKIERPGLTAMLADAKAGEFDKVVVSRLDRLGRNARDLLNVSQQLRDYGVDLVSVRENIDTSTALGRVMFTILAALAELESDQIAERQADYRQRQIDANLTTGGKRPYGYKFDGHGGLAIDDA